MRVVGQKAPYLSKNGTFMIATRTRVAWVLVFVIETPLKASVRVLVLMAAPKRERIALELKNVQSEKKCHNGDKVNGK